MAMDDAHPVDPDAVAKARAHALSAADADRVTAVLAMLADPLVVRLVSALDEDAGTSAAELTAVLGVASETVESTLRRLSDDGIVRNDQSGGPRRYRLSWAGLAHIVTLLSSAP